MGLVEGGVRVTGPRIGGGATVCLDSVEVGC